MMVACNTYYYFDLLHTDLIENSGERWKEELVDNVTAAGLSKCC